MQPNDKYKIHQDLGRVYYRKGDFHNAIEAYQKALSMCDSDYKIHYDMAAAYNSLKDFKSAIECYLNALKLKENDLYTMNSLASTYISNGDLLEAKELAKIIKTKDDYLGNKLFKQIEENK